MYGASENWTISSFTRLELPVTCKLTSKKFNCSAISLKSSETKEIHFPHHRMTILEQYWDEEATNINQTKFFRSNVTLEAKSSYFPSLPSLSQFSHLKIPLISAGGAILFILLVSIGIELAVNRRTDRPTGDVNVNTTNSANNDNKAANTANNDNDINDDGINLAPTAPEITPPPPFNYPGMKIEDILEKKANKRSPEEQDLVLQYIREKKELEASQQR